MTFLRLIILWCCMISVFPQAMAEDDPDFLRGSALYQHGKGDHADYPEALEHFKKAAEKGHTKSQYYVGRMYQLEPEIGIDLEIAKKWYRLAAEKGDSMSWNNLGVMNRDAGGPAKFTLECFNRAVEIDDNPQAHYNLGFAYLRGSYGLLPDLDKAMMHIQKAAERGQPFAGWKAGMIYLEGFRSIKPDNLKAIHYFSLGAKNGHGWAMWHLGDLLQKEEIKAHYDPETLKSWNQLHQNFCDQAENDVKSVLAKVRVSYEEGNNDAACRTLDEALERWRGLTVDSYDWFYIFKIWDAAQFREGRSDMKWSYFLFSYIYGYYERRGEDSELPNPRNNMNDCLAELGQFGLLRESLEVTKGLIQKNEGIDVDAALGKAEVGADYQVIGAEKLPLFVGYGDQRRNTSGDFIGGLAMGGLANVADESLARGDWKSALIIAEWCQRWSDAFRKAGVTPQRSFPAFEARFQHLPMEYRMKVFYALGLTDREMEAARQIIDLKSESHGGKWRQIAQMRIYDVAVEQGHSSGIDLKEMESLEENIRNNPSMEGYKWKYAKLIRAKVIAKTKGLNEGLPLVDQVIEETKDDVLGPLRLEALMVAAKLSLEAGVTDRVPALLGEALESARNRGLLFEEMRIYQLYVGYLLATHQYEAAVEMQNRVIELIKALKLAPRLAGELARLEEIVSLQKQNLVAAPSGKAGGATPVPEATPRDSQQNEARGDSPAPRHPGATRSSLSLQPQGIRTLPIAEEASSVFLLSNISTEPAKATFKLKSDQLRFILDEQLKEQVTVLCKGEGETGTHELDCHVDVPGGGKIPIILTAEGIGSIKEGIVSISLLGNPETAGANQVSQWIIQRDSEAGIIAVVDAAHLTDSNFSLVPVFHQLSSTGGDSKAEMRVIASEPTRVEGYAADGTLLFVDAQGNGSFADAGDLVATEKMDNLNPVLTSGPISGRIALRYRPHAKSLSHRLEIRLETRGMGKTDDWKLDAVDWLEP